MNLLELFEKMSNAHKVQIDKDVASQMHSAVPTRSRMDKEGFVHGLIEPFVIMFWRNRPDDQVLVSINSDAPLIPLTEDLIDQDMTYMHRHDYIEMAYVVRGEFSQVIGGQKRTFTQGSVCIIDRNSQHAEYVKNQDNFVVFLCMKEDFFNELFISEIDNSSVQQFIRKALLKQKSSKQFLQFIPRNEGQSIFNLIEEVVAEKIENNKGATYIIKGLMIRIFDILTKHYELSLTSTQLKKMNDLLFMEVEEYLRNNFKDASLNGLVKRFHFQEDYFTRLIKRHTGLTYSQLLRKIRISKAEELLLNTNMSISNIIKTIGYENRHHFYKIFFEFHNMTPGQYRQKYDISVKTLFFDKGQ